MAVLKLYKASTLIESLVALLIISISLGAFLVSSQRIQFIEENENTVNSTYYLDSIQQVVTSKQLFVDRVFNVGASEVELRIEKFEKNNHLLQLTFEFWQEEKMRNSRVILIDYHYE